MPQLDLMHFFSQFFWFSIVFVSLFFYINFKILPLLVTVLKYRSKKLVSLSRKIGDSKKDAVELHSFYDSLVLSSFKIANQNLTYSISESKKLVEENLSLISTDVFYDCNKAYFTFIQFNSYKDFVFNKRIKNEL